MQDPNQKVVFDQYGNAIPVLGGAQQGYGQQPVYYQQNSINQPQQGAGQQPYYAQALSYDQQPYGGGTGFSQSVAASSGYGNPHGNGGGGDPVVQIIPIKPKEEASNKWNDVPFAILFAINVCIVGFIMGLWGISSLDSSSDAGSFISAEDTQRVAGFTGGLAALAAILSVVLVKFLVKFSHFAIQFSLWFSVGLAIAFAILGFKIGNMVIGVIGLIFAAISVCYAYAVRNRIPFASINLKTAASAVKKHQSLYCVSVLLMVLQFAWLVTWSLAMMGILDEVNKTVNPGGFENGSKCSFDSDCKTNFCASSSSKSSSLTTKTCSNASLKGTSYAYYFLMLVSLYWTVLVFQNIQHTTVAGTVASWWFSSNSKGATGSALKRSFTTSLGSICFGSLLVAIIRALRQLAEEASREGDIGACIAACCLSCLESLLEYFNKWAFVYVGVYGHKFTTAGKAVFDLFKQRGFDAIINDDLIGNALGLTAVSVGLLCSGIGLGVYYLDESILTFDNAPVFVGILGFFVGAGIATIPLTVIDSAVATVFVCFAEDPAVFAQNHPELHNAMVDAWYQLYPEVMVTAGYHV